MPCSLGWAKGLVNILSGENSVVQLKWTTFRKADLISQVLSNKNSILCNCYVWWNIFELLWASCPKDIMSLGLIGILVCENSWLILVSFSLAIFFLLSLHFLFISFSFVLTCSRHSLLWTSALGLSFTRWILGTELGCQTWWQGFYPLNHPTNLHYLFFYRVFCLLCL